MPAQMRAELPPYPQPVGTYETYEAAQKAVDYLADADFPVENVAIVGTDLKTLERVTGRLSWGRVLGAGAASGAWFGVFVGLLLGLFAQEGTWLAIVLTGILTGAVFGMAFAAAGYAATRGQRDFSSTTRIVASRYEILCAHTHAQRARELLAKHSLSNPTGGHIPPATEWGQASNP